MRTLSAKRGAFIFPLILGALMLSSCATKPPKECPEGLYLPAHAPEKCVPKEQQEKVVKEPVNPIVGTYEVHYLDEKIGHQSLLRVYPNGKASNHYGGKKKWEETEDGFRFFDFYRRWNYQYTVAVTTILNKEALLTTDLGRIHSAGNFEAIKISSDPDYDFDHFVIGTNKGPNFDKHYYCFNVGRKQIPYSQFTGYGVAYPTSLPRYAKTAEECASLCERLIIDRYGSLEGRSCPDS